MPNYKVVDAEKLDADLKSVADAIRDKCDADAMLDFPDGYTEKIASIQDFLELRITNTLSEYTNDTITYLQQGAFNECSFLKKASFASVERIKSNTFTGCNLSLGINLPSVKQLDGWAFNGVSVKKFILPSVETIDGGNTFNYNSHCMAWILPNKNIVCSLGGTAAFNGTALAGNTGNTGGKKANIYVPSVLLSSYKAATNWSAYADLIVAIEDYPDIVAELVELGHWEV